MKPRCGQSILFYSIPVILDLLEFEDREVSNFFISMACEVTLTNPGSMVCNIIRNIKFI